VLGTVLNPWNPLWVKLLRSGSNCLFQTRCGSGICSLVLLGWPCGSGVMVGREIKSFCRGQWVWLGKSCLGNGLGMGLGLVGFFLGGSAARPRENGLGIWVPQVDGNAKITHENRPKSAASKYFNRTDFRRACGLTLRGGGRGGPGAAVVGGRGGLFRVGDALVRSIKSGGGCAAICCALRTYGRRVVRYCPALFSSRIRAQRSFGNRCGGSLARSRAGKGWVGPCSTTP